MVRSLLGRGASVKRVPWTADLRSEATDVDGIVIGNGPGDPGDLELERLRVIRLVRVAHASSVRGAAYTEST